MVKDHGKCGASSKASISLVTHSYIILYLQFNSLLPVRVKVSAECAPHMCCWFWLALSACSFPVSFRPHCRQPLSISLLDSFASFVLTNTLSKHLVHCDLHRVLKLWPSCFVCADFPKWCFVHCEFKAQQVVSLRPELFRHAQRNGADSRATEELMLTSKEVAVFCPHGALAAKKELRPTIIIFAA